MREEIKDDEVLFKIEFRINKRPSSLKTADDFQGINWDKKMEHDKPAIRCKVERAFLIVKKQMHYYTICAGYDLVLDERGKAAERH